MFVKFCKFYKVFTIQYMHTAYAIRFTIRNGSENQRHHSTGTVFGFFWSSSCRRYLLRSARISTITVEIFWILLKATSKFRSHYEIILPHDGIVISITSTCEIFMVQFHGMGSTFNVIVHTDYIHMWLYVYKKVVHIIWILNNVS